MANWLFKSEPGVFSYEQLEKAGKAGTEWTGIRNYGARNHMRAMKIGDEGFFYYSNEGKCIVGVVEVCKLAHVDSTADNPTWECVDIRAVAKLQKPISLEHIKKEKTLAKMVLINNSRLSVQPVTDAEWEQVLKMAAAK